MRYKLWVDDMKGVRGKKYSPFLNVCMVYAGIPVKEQYKKDNIHFVSTARSWDVGLSSKKNFFLVANTLKY